MELARLKRDMEIVGGRLSVMATFRENAMALGVWACRSRRRRGVVRSTTSWDDKHLSEASQNTKTKS